VRTDADERLKKALVGAWYETMAIMSGRGKASKESISFMAEQAGGTDAEFRAQLKTTSMFYTPAKAAEFTKSPDLVNTMKYVAQFSFDHGLYGDGAPSADLVGIEFSDGKVLGDKANIKLRFDSRYMEMAADGKL
jgi:NitT/TauT family transport system substrate-binding protein